MSGNEASFVAPLSLLQGALQELKLLPHKAKPFPDLVLIHLQLLLQVSQHGCFFPDF